MQQLVPQYGRSQLKQRNACHSPVPCEGSAQMQQRWVPHSQCLPAWGLSSSPAGARGAASSTEGPASGHMEGRGRPPVSLCPAPQGSCRGGGRRRGHTRLLLTAVFSSATHQVTQLAASPRTDLSSSPLHSNSCFPSLTDICHQRGTLISG